MENYENNLPEQPQQDSQFANIVPALIQFFSTIGYFLFAVPFALWMRAVNNLAAQRKTGSLRIGTIKSPWPLFTLLETSMHRVWMRCDGIHHVSAWHHSRYCGNDFRELRWRYHSAGGILLFTYHICRCTRHNDSDASAHSQTSRLLPSSCADTGCFPCQAGQRRLICLPIASKQEIGFILQSAMKRRPGLMRSRVFFRLLCNLAYV